MSENELTLSVILNNYNGSKLLRGAIDAICAQSYKPSELIVIDDGSTDDSLSVIKEAAATYDYVKLIANEQNIGAIQSACRGLTAATGSVVFFTSCDDLVRPGLFEAGMKLLMKYPQAGICSSDTVINCPAYDFSYEHRQGWRESAGYLSPQQLARRLNGGGMHTNTALIRRDAIARTEFCPEELRWHADWWTYHVIAFRRGMCYTPEILGDYTQDHHRSYSSGMYDEAAQISVLLAVAKLACSKDYSDVLPLIIKSKILAPHFYRVVSWPVLARILRQHQNACAWLLVGHLFSQALCPRYTRQLQELLASWKEALSELCRLVVKNAQSLFATTQRAITEACRLIGVLLASWREQATSMCDCFIDQLSKSLLNPIYYAAKGRCYDLGHFIYKLYFHGYHAYAKARKHLARQR